MEKFDFSIKNLRKFGITMFVAFLVIALLILIRHKHNPTAIASISALFLVAALTIPIALKPIYIAWMKLALILSWINTRLILLIVFYLVITPIGFFMRLFGNDPLDMRIEKKTTTYWRAKNKQPNELADYQKRF